MVLRFPIIKLDLCNSQNDQQIHCKSIKIKKTADLVVCLIYLSPVVVYKLCVFVLCLYLSGALIMFSCSNFVILSFNTHGRACTGGGSSAVRTDRPVCVEAGECHSDKRSSKTVHYKDHEFYPK